MDAVDDETGYLAVGALGDAADDALDAGLGAAGCAGAVAQDFAGQYRAVALQQSAHLHRGAYLEGGIDGGKGADGYRDAVDQQAAAGFQPLDAAFDVHRVGAGFAGFVAGVGFGDFAGYDGAVGPGFRL